MSANETRYFSQRGAGSVTLAAVLLLSSAAQGMYDPDHGRWFAQSAVTT